MKVEIPKEVADAIERYIHRHKETHGIVGAKIKLLSKWWDAPPREWCKEIKIINDYFVCKRTQLLDVIANGYTVKPKPITLTITPEQQRRLLGKINLFIDRYDTNGALSLKSTLRMVGLDTDGEKVWVVKEDD